MKKGKIAHEILRVLSGRGMSVASLSGSSISSAFIPRLEERGIGKKRKNSVRVAIDRLRRQKFVEYTNNSDRGHIRLTSAGEMRIRQYDLEGLKLEDQTRWDRIWRIVMFDIPEEKKVARDAVSRKLKNIGFYQLQKSVFIHHNPCLDEIGFIEEFFGLEGMITYVEANSIGKQEGQIRKFFRIRV